MPPGGRRGLPGGVSKPGLYTCGDGGRIERELREKLQSGALELFRLVRRTKLGELLIKSVHCALEGLRVRLHGRTYYNKKTYEI